MRFYITDHGENFLADLESKWENLLTKEQYFAEIKRQEEEAPRTKSGRGAMMARYNKKVRDET